MAENHEIQKEQDINEIESLVNHKDDQHQQPKDEVKKKRGLIHVISRHKKLTALFVVLFVAYTLGLVYGLKDAYQTGEGETIDKTEDRKGTQKVQKRKITIKTGAVVSDHETCTKIGRDILLQGGSAVDSTIATLLCDGLFAPHSTGIGGGCFMVLYDAKTKTAEIIDGRETAPNSASPEMFMGTTGYHGGKFIGIPGEIPAFWKAHKKYGKLPWDKLFLPSIKLAEDGHYVSHSLARALKIMTRYVDLSSFPTFCDIYCDEFGNPKVEGDIVKRPKFAETLRQIAIQGPNYLYNSNVTEIIAMEIAQSGGVMVADDFRNYSVVMGSGLTMNVGDFKLHTLNAPSGGPVLGLILRILEGIKLRNSSMQSTEELAWMYHTIIEAFKLAYADRVKLGDPAFYPKVKKVVDKMTSETYAQYLRRRIDQQRTHDISYYTNSSVEYEEMGTAHVSVLAPNGDAVSATSTVNYYFGSFVVSESTGIIWNNEMADFYLERGANTGNIQIPHVNAVEPGKRPLSSMVPAIFTDKNGHVQLVVGAAGGSMITTTVAQVVLRTLFLGESVDEAVRAKRIHHQLRPNILHYEFGFPQDVIDILVNKYGHEVKKRETYMSVVEVISRNRKTEEITAFADERKIPGKALFTTKEMNVAEVS